MKKTLIIAAMAVFGIANAQMQKGSWVIGATSNLGFNSCKTTVEYAGQTEDAGTTNTFSFNPSFGYFVKDNLAVGLDLGYVSTTNKLDDTKVSVNSFSVLPTATYYFHNEGNIIPYLGAGIGYTSVTTKYSIPNIDFLLSGLDTSETMDGLTLKGKGGIVILLNKNIGVDLGLSYEHFSNKETYDGADVKTKVGALGVNAGITVFLNGKSSKSTSN